MTSGGWNGYREDLERQLDKALKERDEAQADRTNLINAIGEVEDMLDDRSIAYPEGERLKDMVERLLTHDWNNRAEMHATIATLKHERHEARRDYEKSIELDIGQALLKRLEAAEELLLHYIATCGNVEPCDECVTLLSEWRELKQL